MFVLPVVVLIFRMRTFLPRMAKTRASGCGVGIAVVAMHIDRLLEDIIPERLRPTDFATEFCVS